MQTIFSQLSVGLKDSAVFALPIVLLILGVAVIWTLARHEGAAAPSENAKAAASSASDVNKQVEIIVSMLRDFVGATRDYSSQLASINDRLSRNLTADDLQEIVRLLIQDNKTLVTSTRDLERRLEEAQSTIQQLTSNLHQAKEIGDRDPLTSLYNQRHFNATLQKQIKLSDSVKRPLSLLLLDVDNFKQINDEFGHLVGDEVLKTLSTVIQGSLRGGDIAARYGGDEFAIILPNASVGNAKMIAERILALLRLKNWKFGDRDLSRSVTISIGVAALAANDSPKTLFERADASLYKSKASGKDRVSLDLARTSAAQLESSNR